jgi:GAF domain-containing protein
LKEKEMADAKDIQAELMTRYLGLMPAAGEDQVLRLIVETGVRAVGADEGSLLVYDPEANDLTFVMTYGNKESEDILVGQRVPFGQGLAGLAAETGQVQIGAPRYKDVRQSETMGGIKAVISAPMMLGDTLIGVITAVSNKDDKRFTMDDAQLYACLATIAALVVNQALRLRARETGADAAALAPAALAADPLAEEVLARVGRLLQRDSATVRQLARMLEAVEAMAPGGATQ